MEARTDSGMESEPQVISDHRSVLRQASLCLEEWLEFANKVQTVDPPLPERNEDELPLWQSLQSEQRPPRVYHVVYEGSRSTHSAGEGIKASAQWSAKPSNEDFQRLVEDHFAWTPRKASSMIAVFADEGRARDWAHAWSRSHSRRWYQMVVIDPHCVHLLYSVKQLVELLQIALGEDSAPHEDEYLVPNQIPAWAIVSIGPKKRCVATPHPGASEYGQKVVELRAGRASGA